MLVSWLARQTPLFLLALALLLAAGLSQLWKRYCLAGLEYRRRFSHQRVAFGETIELEIEIELIDTVVVFPRVVPVTALGLPAHEPLGNWRVHSWLFEDPSRLVGARAYRPGDSLRRINWAASARTQQLQVKVYEPTTSHKLMLFLDLNTTPGEWWGLIYDSEALELSISTTASLAAWALAAGYPVGLATNGTRRFAPSRLAVEPTSSPTQLPAILEALGRLQPFAVRPFDRT